MKTIVLLSVLVCIAACAPQNEKAQKCAQLRAKLDQLHSIVEGDRGKVSADEYRNFLAMEAAAAKAVTDACGP